MRSARANACRPAREALDVETFASKQDVAFSTAFASVRRPCPRVRSRSCQVFLRTVCAFPVVRDPDIRTVHTARCGAGHKGQANGESAIRCETPMHFAHPTGQVLGGRRRATFDGAPSIDGTVSEPATSKATYYVNARLEQVYEHTPCPCVVVLPGKDLGAIPERRVALSRPHARSAHAP
jgi:hypothetical protein